ncbi:hypothetical protein ACFXTN_017444 [Malus domestica]
MLISYIKLLSLPMASQGAPMADSFDSATSNLLCAEIRIPALMILILMPQMTWGTPHQFPTKPIKTPILITTVDLSP